VVANILFIFIYTRTDAAAARESLRETTNARVIVFSSSCFWNVFLHKDIVVTCTPIRRAKRGFGRYVGTTKKRGFHDIARARARCSVLAPPNETKIGRKPLRFASVQRATRISAVLSPDLSSGQRGEETLARRQPEDFYSGRPAGGRTRSFPSPSLRPVPRVLSTAATL